MKKSNFALMALGCFSALGALSSVSQATTVLPTPTNFQASVIGLKACIPLLQAMYGATQAASYVKSNHPRYCIHATWNEVPGAEVYSLNQEANLPGMPLLHPEAVQGSNPFIVITDADLQYALTYYGFSNALSSIQWTFSVYAQTYNGSAFSAASSSISLVVP